MTREKLPGRGRLLLAGLAASLAGAVAAWAGYTLLMMALTSPGAALAAAPSLLGFFLLIGWPIALVGVLVAGPLLYYLLARQKLLRRLPVALAGAAVGAVVLPFAWLELVSLLGDLPGAGGAVIIGALSGFAAGWAFWKASRPTDRADRREAAPAP